ncbi:hypothetical protein ACFX2G_044009 [Malus domestica]
MSRWAWTLQEMKDVDPRTGSGLLGVCGLKRKQAAGDDDGTVLRRWGFWRSDATGVESIMALGRPVVCGELQVEGTAGRENPDWALRAGPGPGFGFLLFWNFED